MSGLPRVLAGGVFVPLDQVYFLAGALVNSLANEGLHSVVVGLILGIDGLLGVHELHPDAPINNRQLLLDHDC